MCRNRMKIKFVFWLVCALCIAHFSQFARKFSMSSGTSEEMNDWAKRRDEACKQSKQNMEQSSKWSSAQCDDFTGFLPIVHRPLQLGFETLTQWRHDRVKILFHVSIFDTSMQMILNRWKSKRLESLVKGEIIEQRRNEIVIENRKRNKARQTADLAAFCWVRKLQLPQERFDIYCVFEWPTGRPA